MTRRTTSRRHSSRETTCGRTPQRQSRTARACGKVRRAKRSGNRWIRRGNSQSNRGAKVERSHSNRGGGGGGREKSHVRRTSSNQKITSRITLHPQSTRTRRARREGDRRRTRRDGEITKLDRNNHGMRSTGHHNADSRGVASERKRRHTRLPESQSRKSKPVRSQIRSSSRREQETGRNRGLADCNSSARAWETVQTRHVKHSCRRPPWRNNKQTRIHGGAKVPDTNRHSERGR